MALLIRLRAQLLLIQSVVLVDIAGEETNTAPLWQIPLMMGSLLIFLLITQLCIIH